MANANRVVLTPEGRMSFANLLTAREYKERGKGTGKFSYTVDLLFGAEAMAKFQTLDTATGKLAERPLGEILAELAREQWPGIVLKEVFVGLGMKGWPIKSGDAIAEAAKAKQKDAEHYRGTKVVSLKSNVSDKVQPPTLSAVVKGAKPRVFNRGVQGDMEVARSLFQGGNYAMAELNIVANEVSGAKFLTPYMNAVRYIREGAKFGNRGGDLMDRFGGISGGEADYDPTAGNSAAATDDEIPF